MRFAVLSPALLLGLSCAADVGAPARLAPPGAPIDFPLPPLPPLAQGASTAEAASTLELRAPSPTLPPVAEAAIDDLVAKALAAGKLPGCVVVVGRHDAVLLERAYGSRSVQPVVTPMTVDTVFDLASLTKPLATASSIVLLADRGQVDLDAPLGKYLPELGDRGAATLRQALTHTAGFVADTPLADYDAGLDEVLRRMARAKLRYAPGTDSRYSDVGFILLGEVVRRVTGEDLARFSREAVFAPLGMTETGFLPSPALALRAAPTENVDGRWLQGEVHDPRARAPAMGGVAGHAGVFSTAADLVLYAEAMLGGRPSFLSPRALRGFTAPHDLPGGVRALGWDVRSAYSTNRGTSLSPRAFGHGGYTGTSLWIDPAKDLFVLFLSNRVHPDGHGEVNPLVGAITDVAARAVAPDVVTTPPGCRAAEAPGPPVETGLDVLADEKFAPLAGRRVGLITNASGLSRDGKRDVDLFVGDAAVGAGVKLVAIFAPEHGLATDQDVVVADGRDSRTGLPVYSLYGDHFTPNDTELQGVDTLVVNLPDVGVRFFTYASTMHRALGAAAKHGLRFVVLDRPNPIDGVHVEGPLLSGPQSFANHAVLPVRHGMTMGELALLFDAEDHEGAELEVIPLRGWSADRMWSDLGLPWVPPSPNLRTPTEALLYPGVALLEATNVSVGRGTDSPFELVGAPWMDGAKVVAALRSDAALRGARVEPATFIPTSSRFHGQSCEGVRIAVTDTATFEPVTFGIALAVALRRLYPGTWEVSGLAPLLSSRAALASIESGARTEDVVAAFRADVASFSATRERYLLYPRRACP